MRNPVSNIPQGKSTQSKTLKKNPKNKNKKTQHLWLLWSFMEYIFKLEQQWFLYYYIYEMIIKVG